MALRRRLVGLDFDAHRVAQELRGEARDRRLEGRREQNGLAHLRRLGGDALDVVDEAHVEHAVGLVEHEHLELREVDAAALEVVDQAARRGDENVDAAAELADLRRIRRTAIDAHDAHPRVLAVLHGLRGYLLRQLARRRQHQHARIAHAVSVSRCRPRSPRHGRNTLQGRQHEGRRLAGAGLRRADDVAALEQRRNGLALDGRRRFIAAGGERAQQVRREL